MPQPLTTWVTNKLIIERSDGTCLFLRDTGMAPGHEDTKGWPDFPGGRMDEGEMDLIRSMRREVMEEIGFSWPEAMVPERVSVQMWQKKSGEVGLVTFWRIAWDGPVQAVLSEEHSEVLWDTVANILPMLPPEDTAYTAALREYLER